MLRNYGNRACRCASTSTSSPCLHAAPHISSQFTLKRHLSSESPTAIDASTENGAALNYTAPLWPSISSNWHLRKTPIATLRWDKKSWIKRSQTTIVGAIGGGNLPPPAPFPSFSLHIDPPPPLERKLALDTSQRTETPEANLILLQRYLTLGSPLNRSLLALERVPVRLLNAADEHRLPLVRKQILWDLARSREVVTEGQDVAKFSVVDEKGRVGRLPVKEAKVGEVETGEAEDIQEGEVSAGEPRIESKPNTRIDVRRDLERKAMLFKGSVTRVKPSSSKDIKKSGRRIRWVEVGQTLKTIIEKGVATPPDEIDFPEALVAETPDLTGSQRLESLWESFVEEKKGGDETEMTLKFLTFLATSPPTLRTRSEAPSEPPIEHIKLALRVIRSLPSSFSSLLDPPDSSTTYRGTDTPLSPATNAQFIILRTVTFLALDHNRLELARAPLLALTQLRQDVSDLVIEGEGIENDFEFSTSIEIVKLLTHESYISRQSAYRPLDTLTDSLKFAHFLLTTVVPPLAHSYPRIFNEVRQKALFAFAREAAFNRRWDLLRDVYGTWTTGERETLVIPAEVRLAFLRWLAGESRYRDYGKATSERDAEGHSIRSVHADLFLTLAKETNKLLDRASQSLSPNEANLVAHVNATLGERSAILNWTLEQKGAWIELLCSSRAADARSATHARQFYRHLRRHAPLGTQRPFVLPPRALLALVHASNGTSQLDFARSVISDHVAAITNPRSPFAAPGARLDHCDLTTLAQAYTLVGDFASYDQVYRRFLAQKMLPDRKDIDVVLGATAAYDWPTAKGFVEKVYALGLPLDLQTWRGMIRTVMSMPGHRTRGEKQRELVQEIVTLANEGGQLDASQRQQLAMFADSHFAQGDRQPHLSRYNEVDPLVVRRALVTMARKGKVASAASYYRRVVKTGLVDGKSFQIVLRLLCDLCRRHAKAGGSPAVARDLADLIDSTVSATPTLLRSEATLRLALEGCGLVGEVRAGEVLLEHVRRAGLITEEEMDRFLADWRVQLAVSTVDSE